MTETEYKAIRARIDRLNKWLDSIRDKRTGWVSYHPSEKPASVPDVSNEEISSVEVWEFIHDPPDRYCLYINEKKAKATTWTGEKLGQVIFGREYRDNFGGVRVPIEVFGVNGVQYYGTYYKSAGNYARIKRYKHQQADA